MDMRTSDFFELLFTYAPSGAWNLATLLISFILVMSTSLCCLKYPLVANLLVGLLCRYTSYLCIYVIQWEYLNIMLPTFSLVCVNLGVSHLVLFDLLLYEFDGIFFNIWFSCCWLCTNKSCFMVLAWKTREIGESEQRCDHV